MLLLRAAACPPRSVLTRAIKGLLGFATLLVCVGPACAVVEQDCALPDADCALAETARQAGVFMGAAIGSPELPAVQTTIPRDFNSITAENAMKWGSLAPTVGNYDFTDADAIAEFAASAGVRLRGHTLLWRNQLPADLKSTVEAAADPATRLRELIDEHLSTVVPRYRDVVSVWDVVNEPLRQYTGDLDPNIFGRTLGEAYIEEAFHRAHELDPDAKLVLNEFFLFYGLGTPLEGKARGFLDLVERLLERGVPVHGVGVQAHFFGLEPGLFPLPARAEFEGFLRALADLGVAVELTELDVSINYFRGDPDPLARQAEFYGEAHAAGDLRGRDSALGRTRRALVQAGSLLQRAHFRAACHKLELVDRLLAPSHGWRCEWLFVRGPAAADLADAVGTLREGLDCDDRHFGGGPRAWW